MSKVGVEVGQALEETCVEEEKSSSLLTATAPNFSQTAIIVQFEENDPENPQNWAPWRKWSIVSLVAMMFMLACVYIYISPCC